MGFLTRSLLHLWSRVGTDSHFMSACKSRYWFWSIKRLVAWFMNKAALVWQLQRATRILQLRVLSFECKKLRSRPFSGKGALALGSIPPSWIAGPSESIDYQGTL